MSLARSHDLWRRYVNPDLVGLLETLGFARDFVRGEGATLFDREGREYVDFLAGYGVHNVGHNHPRVVAVVKEALGRHATSMLNIDAPEAAGLLAERLTGLMRPELCRTAFANSGAEAVEHAMKASRAATGRSPLLACEGAYHGLTTGALCIMGDDRHRSGGACSHGCGRVPFGDARALAGALEHVKPAAFFVEPVQGEGGMRVPPDGYLTEAARLCRDAGTLFIVDEIQTGVGRTGGMFATDFADIRPDVVLVGKALSAGIVPVAAAVMTEDVWKRAFAGPERFYLCASTFAGGFLASVVGREVLAVVEEERLDERAEAMGRRLLEGLRGLAARHDIVRDVRGRGLMVGVEFAPPAGLLVRAVPKWARQGLYAHVVSALLLKDHGIVTQPCSVAQNVLRAEPPLVVCEEEIDLFATALDEVLAKLPSHGSAVLAAAVERFRSARR
ncbi:MAG: aspartate aminotransferase family protein [Planctomycetota bacterium]